MPQIPEDVLKLIEIYSKAQENLIKVIADKEARGRVSDYQKSILSQVNEQLQELNKEVYNWTSDAISKHYNEGIEQVRAALEALKIDIPKANTFAGLHTAAIELLAKNAYQDLIDANYFVGRQVYDAVRKAGLDAIAQKLSVGETVKQCKKNLTMSLIDEGINGIKDKRGRMISLDAYAETVARSTTREATNRAALNQLTALGYDLVKVDSHAATCPVCAPLEGRVYSISGKDTRYPPLSRAYSGPHANIHPNCRHVLVPYIEALDSAAEKTREFSNRPFEIEPTAQKKVDVYNEVQQAKRKMRDDRNQWQRYRLAMPDDTPKTFSGFRRMKNSNSGKYQELENMYRNLMTTGSGNVTINERLERKAINKFLKNANITDRKALATHLLNQAGLSHINISMSNMSYRGACRFDNNSTLPGNKIRIDEYVLQGNDPRKQEYQIKTAFHEFYHANSDGLEHDMHKIGGLSNWAIIDDTFAECTAHYINSMAGIRHELMPAYSSHLVENLPKLKMLKEFKDCNNIIEFGERFSKYRFSKRGKTAKWENYFNHVKSTNINIAAYANHYTNYIQNNIDDITDKIYENMDPAGINIKPMMKQDILNGLNKVVNNNLHSLTRNEEHMFYDSMIVAMNRMGVK